MLYFAAPDEQFRFETFEGDDYAGQNGIITNTLTFTGNTRHQFCKTSQYFQLSFFQEMDQ
jgi:hypothetical protein